MSAGHDATRFEKGPINDAISRQLFLQAVERRSNNGKDSLGSFFTAELPRYAFACSRRKAKPLRSNSPLPHSYFAIMLPGARILRSHPWRDYSNGIRDLQPHARQHVNRGVDHLHMECRFCWNNGLRPQRRNNARRRRSSQHLSSRGHQRDGKDAHQRSHDLCRERD